MWMHKQFNESSRHTRLNHRLNFIVIPVGQVRNRPTRIDQNLIIQGINQFREHGQRGVNQFPVRRGRFPATKIRERPRRVPHHTHLSRIVQEFQERGEGALLKDKVAHFGTVACDVAERPDGLFTDIGFGATE
jgi:hypothetical protein